MAGEMSKLDPCHRRFVNEAAICKVQPKRMQTAAITESMELESARSLGACAELNFLYATWSRIIVGLTRKR